MQNLLVIMDMNKGFAKKGNLFSPRTANLIDPIADYCKKSKEKVFDSDLRSIYSATFSNLLGIERIFS